MKEETTLTSSTVNLWRKGRPFSFCDESVGREWTVYPFAFLLKAPKERLDGRHPGEENVEGDADGITLDWEHDFYNWYDPVEVLSRLEQQKDGTVGGQQLVPRLADSLRNIYPEYELGSVAGKLLTKGLQRLQNDHESGARELAAIALTILREILMEARPSTVQATGSDDHWTIWWRKVRLVSWHLWTNGRESMGAAIGSALILVLAELEKVYELETNEEEIAAVIQRSIERRTATTERLCTTFNSYIQDYVDRKGRGEASKKSLKVMTLSASSTIRECIQSLVRTNDGRDLFDHLDVRILESRPLYEGVTLATTLSESLPSTASPDKTGADVEITLYTDSSAALAARDVDIVLIGADRISGSDGAVSNKTGSLPAILSAKSVSRQALILVVSEFDKVAPASEEFGQHGEENNEAEEVVRGWRLAGVKGADVIDRQLGARDGSSCLAVKNVYFEWVPPDTITAYITDDGVKGVAEIRDRSAWVGQQVQRFFHHL